MNVGELIEFLKGYPSDWVVVMSSDGEGNGYSPAATAEKSRYLAYNYYSGETYVPDEVVDDPGSPYAEGDRAPKEAVPCVLLWPVN